MTGRSDFRGWSKLTDTLLRRSRNGYGIVVFAIGCRVRTRGGIDPTGVVIRAYPAGGRYVDGDARTGYAGVSKGSKPNKTTNGRACREVQRGQAGTAVESVIADCFSRGETHRGQAGTAGEGPLADGYYIPPKKW